MQLAPLSRPDLAPGQTRHCHFRSAVAPPPTRLNGLGWGRVRPEPNMYVGPSRADSDGATCTDKASRRQQRDARRSARCRGLGKGLVEGAVDEGRGAGVPYTFCVLQRTVTPAAWRTSAEARVRSRRASLSLADDGRRQTPVVGGPQRRRSELLGHSGVVVDVRLEAGVQVGRGQYVAMGVLGQGRVFGLPGQVDAGVDEELGGDGDGRVAEGQSDQGGEVAADAVRQSRRRVAGEASSRASACAALHGPRRA